MPSSPSDPTATRRPPRTTRRARRGLAVALALTAFFALAELPFAALMADDLMQLGALEGVLPSSAWTGPLSLYTISDGVPAHVRAMQDVGAFPWFFGSRFEMRFLRPLSSALLAADHALWGLAPAGHRVQSALWLAALAVGVALVVRRAVPGLATLATIVFAISAVHASLFWTATRHVAIAGGLAILALAAHLRWREDGFAAGRALSIAGVALALAASEAGLAALAYLLAYEALGARDARSRRIIAISPHAILVLAYLAAYAWLGLGAAGGGYADARQAPATFAADVASRWLFLVGALAAGGGADLWVLRPDLRGALALCGAAVAVLAGALLRATGRDLAEVDRRGARWLVAGALASALPFALSPVGSRCLVLPMVGGSVAVAAALHGFRLAPRPRRAAVAAGCATVALLHLGLAPIARLATPIAMRRALHDEVAAAMREAELDTDGLAERRVVVLRAPSFILGLHSYFFRALHRMPMPRAWLTLSWAPCPHRFVRTGPDTLELSLAGCEIEARALAAGDVVDVEGMRARVIERGRTGPRRVEFSFDRPLDDASLGFLAWRDGRLRAVPMPPVGSELLP